MENKPINELNEVYDYLSSDDELYHHGVLGMKWGIRRYQPYSLIPRGSGKRGKEVGAAKSSKSTSSSSGSSKRTKKKSRKQTQEEIKAQKIKNLQTARQRSEEKQKILKSGDAKLIYENRDSFTRAQIDEAMNRIDTEKKLRALVAEQNPSKSTKLKKSLTKVVNPENLQKAADVIEKGANLYNQTARVANVFRDDEHQLKYIGKAENKKVEKKLSKELQDILNSGDAQKILDNQSKFNDDQIKNAKQRLDNLQKINQQAKKAQEDSEKRSEKYRSEAFDAVDTYGEKYAREKLARDYGSDNANKLVDSVLTEKKLSELDSQAAARYISKTKYDAVEEERRRKGQYRNGPSSSVVKHSDISVNELTGIYDYLSSDDELYHHGVLGMKWGIRRYQSYDTVPRGSGKGGKEIGEAKGSNKTSKSSNSSSSNSKPYSERNAEELFGNKAMGIKSMRDITDPELLDLSYMEMYEYKDPDWKMSEAAAQKDYDKFMKDPEAYRQELLKSNEKDDTTLSEKTASIKFKPDTGFGYKGETAFSGNPKCLITIEYPEDKKILDRVINNKTLENTMREHAAEMHQYESINPNHEDRDTFKKRLKCDQITIGHTYNPDIVDIWYSHPDDSGAWYMQVNTKNNVVEDEQYYR